MHGRARNGCTRLSYSIGIRPGSGRVTDIICMVIRGKSSAIAGSFLVARAWPLAKYHGQHYPGQGHHATWPVVVPAGSRLVSTDARRRPKAYSQNLGTVFIAL